MLVHDLTFKPHNDCKTSPYDYHDHCEHKPRSHLLSQLAWDLNKDRGLRICPLSGPFRLHRSGKPQPTPAHSVTGAEDGRGSKRTWHMMAIPFQHEQ